MCWLCPHSSPGRQPWVELKKKKDLVVGRWRTNQNNKLQFLPLHLYFYDSCVVIITESWLLPLILDPTLQLNWKPIVCGHTFKQFNDQIRKKAREDRSVPLVLNGILTIRPLICRGLNWSRSTTKKNSTNNIDCKRFRGRFIEIQKWDKHFHCKIIQF